MSEGADSLRLDIWLWRARFFRTRALATLHIRRRGARLTRAGQTRRVKKPGAAITPGDIVTFTRSRNICVVRINDLGTRRGPAAEARNLYDMLDEDDV